MGCVASKIDKEEMVRRCKERKRLMKQLVGFRAKFAAAQMAYLRALKNTGATLRQFADVESLELETSLFRPALPPSPPPPLPPSPPPLPPFSPDSWTAPDDEECIEIGESDDCTPPPPPEQSLSWDFWDPFGLPPPRGQQRKDVRRELQEEGEEEENWADTNTEFVEEEEEGAGPALGPVLRKPPPVAREVVMVDDSSSVVSWETKETDTAMVVWRSKKTMAGIMKELDDYFRKASAGVEGIAILLETNGASQLCQRVGESRNKSGKSAKVFSALSWSWSSRSLQSYRDPEELHESGESGLVDSCKPGAHCRTLEKLYAEEQRLHEKVKEEGIVRLQYEQKTLLLQKQEAEDHDWMKTEKTRSSVEILQSELCCLQQSIARICYSILKLRDEELEPQLIQLSSGLMAMWRTMYECHQVQNHIAQQVNSFSNHMSSEPASDFHIKATLQLENEAASWYNSFCDLLRSQRNYVRTLNHWVELTDYLPDNQFPNSSSTICSLCEEWQLSLDRLPEKVASEAIKSFVSVIKSIVQEQVEEQKLQRRAKRLELTLEKELNLLSKVENKFNEGYPSNNLVSGMDPVHPLSTRRSKVDALRKRLEAEQSKYMKFMETSPGMTLNNLNTCLPNVFQALTGFSGVCAQALEGVYRSAQPTDIEEVSLQAPV